MKYRIRYNKAAGTKMMGTVDHKWRVFDENKQYICKNVIIHCSSWTEQDPNGHDWNIACIGRMEIDKENSIISIF